MYIIFREVISFKSISNTTANILRHLNYYQQVGFSIKINLVKRIRKYQNNKTKKVYNIEM